MLSYDLTVYLQKEMASTDLESLVSSTPSLDISDPATPHSHGTGQLIVDRGKRAGYCFTVDGPFALEAEDVPEEVTATILAPKCVYHVLVEGSDPASIPHAVRFAKKLAAQAQGAVQDAQSGEVWPKKSSRKPSPPAKESPAEVIRVEWFYLLDEMPNDLTDIYCRLARKFLPEALPRRFGTYEPFAGNFDRDGADGFTKTWNEEPQNMLQFYGDYPVNLGFLLGIGCSPRGDVSSTMLTIDRNVVAANPAWNESLKKFFLAFAQESQSFHATAEVLRGYVSNGKRLNMRWDSEKAGRRQYLGEWAGVAPYPQWWTWFTPLYSDLVSPYLTGQLEQHPTGLFHAWSQQPFDRDALQLLLPKPHEPWIPPEYSPAYNEHGHVVSNAAILPERLIHTPPPPVGG